MSLLLLLNPKQFGGSVGGHYPPLGEISSKRRKRRKRLKELADEEAYYIQQLENEKAAGAKKAEPTESVEAAPVTAETASEEAKTELNLLSLPSSQMVKSLLQQPYRRLTALAVDAPVISLSMEDALTHGWITEEEYLALLALAD